MCRVRKRKDRSLRQLLQGNAISVGAAEGCDLLIFLNFDQKSFSGSSLSADSCSRNANT
jgi:hypothetical protein